MDRLTALLLLLLGCGPAHLVLREAPAEERVDVLRDLEVAGLEPGPEREALAVALAELLADERPAVRALAATRLGELKAEAFAAALREALSGESEKAPAKAMLEALGRLGDVSAAPLLVPHLGRRGTRRAALEALRLLGPPVAPALAPHLRRKGRSQVSDRVRGLLGSIGHGEWVDAFDAALAGDPARAVGIPQLAEPLAAHVLEGKEGQRRALTQALLRLDPDRLLEVCTEALRHSVFYASECLGWIGEAAVTPVARLARSGDLESGRRAAQALGRIPHSRATQVLVALARESTEDGVRVAALDALARKKDETLADPLIPLLGDPSRPVRRAAESAVGASGAWDIVSLYTRTLRPSRADRKRGVPAQSQRLRPAWLGLTEDPESGPAAAFEALGDIGDPRDLPRLVAALGAKSKSVRLGAIRGLGRSRNPRAVPILMEAVETSPRDEKKALMLALGSLGDKKAVELMITAFRTARYKDREMAMALARTGDSRAFVPLLRDSGTGWPRHARALELLVAKVGTAPLVKLLANKDGNVASAAGRFVMRYGAQVAKPLSKGLRRARGERKWSYRFALRAIQNAYAAFQGGNALMDAGDCRGAIERFGEAIRVSRGPIAAINNRGVCSLRLGELDAAARDFQRVADSGTRHAKGGHLNLGVVAERRRRPARKSGPVRRGRWGAGRRPRGSKGRLRAGVALKQGLEHTRRSRALDPRYASAAYNEGWLLDAQGELDAAIAAYDVALKLDPRHRHCRLARALTRARQGHREEALATLERLLAGRKGGKTFRALVERNVAVLRQGEGQ